MTARLRTPMLIRSAMLSSLIGLVGCASITVTAIETSGNDRYALENYGGTKLDMAIIGGSKENETADKEAFGLSRPLALLDLPFSFIFDTVALPFTLISSSTSDTPPPTAPPEKNPASKKTPSHGNK